MPAGRYTDWTHVHVVGDRAAAAPYVPYARKLLGWVMQDAAYNQLVTHKSQQVLEDGTVVIAEKHGSIPRITIIPTGGGGRSQRAISGDFVVWARDDAHPAGLDEDHPQQILRMRDDSWKTFFYSEGIAGYEGFSGEKGTYIGTFPDGIQHAGNVDWRGAGDQRLSWYGPSTRYWVDPYVQVRQQYGKQVFMLGQQLLDVQTYDTDNGDGTAAQYVMGAAIEAMHLYVMQADLPEGTTTTEPQEAHVTLVDPYYPVTDIPHRLCRYSIAPDINNPGFMRVINGSRVVLWSQSLRTGGMPWFFDREAGRARCHGVPGGTGIGGIDLAVRVLSGSHTPPSASAPYWTMERDGEDVAVSVGSESVGPTGTGVLASDFDESGALVQIRVRREQLGRSGIDGGNARRDHWHIVMPALDVDLHTIIQRTGYVDWDQRYIMFADAREGILVLAREHYRLPEGTGRQVWVEAYRKGELIHNEQVNAGADAASSTGLRRVFSVDDLVSDVTGNVSVSPMWALYGFLLAISIAEVESGFQQSHAGYLFLPYQAGSYFGAYKISGPAGNPTPVASRCSVTAARARNDKDGKDAPFSAAADKDAFMFSGYAFEQGTLDSVHYVTGTTLQTLTGVTGAQSRYHPLWILGKPHPSAAQG